jgi:hypothetical protein
VPDSAKNHHRRGSRASWAGRPLTLIIGWVLSCALVTGVTLTAVGQVGHEISGTQPQVTTEQQVNKQLTQQASSSSSAAQPASSPQPIASPTPTASPKAGATKPETPAPSPSASTSPSPGHHITRPSVTPTPSHAASPSVKPSTTPIKPAPSPTTQPVSSPPVGSPTDTAVVASPTDSPTASPTLLTGKKTIKVPGNNAPTEGEIIIACSGDTIGQYAIVLTAGSKFSYTTPNPPPDPSVKIDVTFVDPSTATQYHYVVSCADGQVVGSQPLTERAG